MQTTVASSSVSTFAASTAAFSAQNIAGYLPAAATIKLIDAVYASKVKSLAAPAAKKAESSKKAVKAKLKATVEQIVAEGLELAKMHEKYNDEYVVRGNKALYDVLAAIYEYALQINGSAFKDAIVAHMVKVLKDDYKVKTTSKTHWMTTVVKLIVKGTDRQTASNYSRILQIALEENLAAADLAQYIERRGGVAKVRETEAAAAAVSTATDIAKVRGELVKEYYLNAALQSHSIIECDLKGQIWGGDGRTSSEDTKHELGKFEFFVTISIGGNKFRVVEIGKCSKTLEDQILRLIARTFRQSTEEMQAAVTEIKAENAERSKLTVTDNSNNTDCKADLA